MTFNIIAKCKKCVDIQKEQNEKKFLDQLVVSDHIQDYNDQEIQKSFVEAFQL